MITNTELFQKYMQFRRTMHRHGKEGCVPPMGMRPVHPPMHGPHGGPHGHHGPHMRPHGMSRERLLVLIDEHPDGIRQKDLAMEEGINASSTSEVVNRLEEDGYVIRTVDESDRRATLLHLTELGKARAAEIRDEKEAVLEELFSPLSPSEKETLAELLDKLNNR